MKLYWGPHTCAIGIHVLLEEIGKPYEAEKLDVAGGETHKSPFSDINPKAKVPTLVRDDGLVLTEYGAIAIWLGRTNPDSNLLPVEPDAEARALEIMDYVVGTLHGQGFGRIFRTERFQPPDMLHETLKLGQGAVEEEGRQMVERGFSVLDSELGDRPFAAGETFTVAATALFYAERWAPQVDVTLPANIARHFERMIERPAVRRVREIWGEA